MMRDERAPKTSRPRTDVPVAGHRQVSMREIRAVVRQIAERFRPEKIILCNYLPLMAGMLTSARR